MDVKLRIHRFVEGKKWVQDYTVTLKVGMTVLEALIEIAVEIGKPVSILNGSAKDLTAYEQESNSITFIQYQAGAMGGNFQKARRTVYFTLPLGKGSCDLWEQSKKRTHRIGQNQTCFYYYPLVQNSIEVKNLKALKEGKELTDDLFKITKKA